MPVSIGHSIFRVGLVQRPEFIYIWLPYSVLCGPQCLSFSLELMNLIDSHLKYTWRCIGIENFGDDMVRALSLQVAEWISKVAFLTIREIDFIQP